MWSVVKPCDGSRILDSVIVMQETYRRLSTLSKPSSMGSYMSTISTDDKLFH